MEKEKEPILSVIVPCYNNERDIEKCLQSILGQTFFDFEVLVIDDGSEDDSAYVAKKMSLLDQRIRVIQQKRRGVSAARNHGIRLARGIWIAFIDSDDYVESRYFEHLIKPAMEQTCDIVIGGYCYKHPKRLQKIQGIRFHCLKADFLRLYYAECIRRRLLFGPINKIYKRDILKKNGVQFDESIEIREDCIFVFEYLKQCSVLIGIEYAEYYYVQHPQRWTLNKKFHYDEKDINARFFKMILGNMEEPTEKETEAIFPIFLNMELATIRKLYLSENFTKAEGIPYIKALTRCEEYRYARKKLLHVCGMRAFKYFRPVVLMHIINLIALWKKKFSVYVLNKIQEE